MGAKLATQYAIDIYLKTITNGANDEILCILPVAVETKDTTLVTGRRSFLSVLKGSITCALGWNKRVFVAVKKGNKTMLILLKTKTAEGSIQPLKAIQRSKAEDSELDMSQLDSGFSTARGLSTIHLEDANVNALEPLVFQVVPENQGRLLRTHEYILTVAPPDASATDEEKACYNKSMAWLDSATESLL